MPEREQRDLDAPAVFRALRAPGVEFVVIGGMAAILRGASVTTALIGMHAEVKHAGRVMDLGGGDWLTAGSTWNLDTDFGTLDLLFEPAGGGSYEDLAARAQPTEIGDGLTVMVAALEDLIAMKEAAGRPKDLLVLPILRWLKVREETDA